MHRSCVVQELVHLMRTEVAKNATKLIRIPEPIWTPRPASGSTTMLKDLMRCNIDGLNHFANGTLLDETPSISRPFDLKPTTVHDAVYPPGLRNPLPHVSQLLERGDARLVRQEVLAMFHYLNTKRGSFAGDLRTEHQLH